MKTKEDQLNGAIGRKIIDLLGLKERAFHNGGNRVDTNGGTKTPLGLALTIRRIIHETEADFLTGTESTPASLIHEYTSDMPRPYCHECGAPVDQITDMPEKPWRGVCAEGHTFIYQLVEA